MTGAREMLLSLSANEADGELRAEDAARLSAAPADAWVTYDWRRAWRRGTAVGEDVDAVVAGGPVLYGRLPSGLPYAWVPEAERLADRYAGLRTFARHAGRDVALASHGEGRSELVDAVLGLFRRGEETVRVKVAARPKYGMYRVECPPMLSRLTVRDALWRGMGYALEHLAGVPGAFLVQQEVAMRREYRLFVVGHRPVAGAGCVDRHTPADCRAAPFDAAVERTRGDGGVVRDPGAVAALVAFGRDVAAELAAEEPRLTDYTLDVAVGPRGPLVVELNGLRNSGLYACDPTPVVAALLE